MTSNGGEGGVGSSSSAVAAQNLILLNSLTSSEEHHHHSGGGLKNRIQTINQLNDLLSIVNAANTIETTPVVVESTTTSSTPTVANESSDTTTSEVGLVKKSRNNRVAAVPGKPRGATYDGNLCMICSDKASGFHYGVLACEGCKGFFKRVCKDKPSSSSSSSSSCSVLQDDSSSTDSSNINHRRQCVFGGRCEINVRTRNRCQHCRMQKCIDLGMSKGGIKLGRRSKKFKQNLPVNHSTNNNGIPNTQNGSSSDESTTANNSLTDDTTNRTIIESSSIMAHNNQQPQIIAILQDNRRLILKAIDMGSVTATTTTMSNQHQLISIPTLIDNNQIQIVSPMSSNLILSSFDNNQQPTTGTIVLTPQPQELVVPTATVVPLTSHDYSAETTTHSVIHLGENRDQESGLDKSQLRNIKEAVWQAYQDTRSSTSSLNDDEDSARTFQHVESSVYLTSLFDKGLLGLLNESGLLDQLNTLVESAVLFAKNVPYFMNIHEADRINLLKSSVFEIICVQHAKLFQFSNSSNNRSTSSSSLATLAACALGNVNNNSQQDNNDDNTERDEKLLVPVFNVWTSRQWLSVKLPQMSRFLKLLFDFYHYLSRMKLSDTELAFFSSYLLLNADESGGLHDIDKIKNYRHLFLEILINELERSRVVSTSSPTTTMVVDKKDIEIWINTCCIKLKQLNYEHAKLLIENKPFVQFPDLYAELYNLSD